MSNIDTLKPTDVLAELETKLVAAKTLRDQTEASMLAISFDAHSGNAAAHKKLSALHEKAASTALEVRSLEAAVVEARKRVDHASALVADEQQREQARVALGMLEDFESRGRALDKAMQRVLDEYSALTDDFGQLTKLGYAPTTPALVGVNMKLCVQAKLMAAKLESEYLAPDQRRDFAHVISGWSASVRSRIEARIKRNPPSKAA